MTFTIERVDGTPMTAQDWLVLGVVAAVLLFGLYVLAMALVKVLEEREP